MYHSKFRPEDQVHDAIHHTIDRFHNTFLKGLGTFEYKLRCPMQTVVTLSKHIKEK